MRGLRIAALSTISGIALVGHSALAQTAPAPNPAPAPAAVSPTATIANGDIVVTAQRRSESLSRTPVAVSVVGSETLARQAISTQSDLHSLVPGLLIKAGQNSNQLNYAIRGQSLEPFGSVQPGVLPYVNEVEVSGEGASPFYDLQSIQVLKGPQGTLFGRNATGGAVLFTTAKPTDTFGGYISGRLGNYNLRQIEGAVNVPIDGDKVMLRIAGTGEHRGAMQYNLYDGTGVGTVRRWSVRSSLTIAPSSTFRNDTVVSFTHSGGVSMSGVLYSVVPQGEAAATAVPANILFTPQLDSAFGQVGLFQSYLNAHPHADPDGLIAFLAKQKARGPYLIDVDDPGHHLADQISLSNISTFDVADNLQIKNIFGFSHLHSNDIGEFDGSPYDIDQLGPNGRDSRITQVSDELQIVGKALSQNLKYVAGLYYSNERNGFHSESIAFDVSPVSLPATLIDAGIFHDEIKAIYGQATYDLSDVTGLKGLSVTAGGRYTVEKNALNRTPDDQYVKGPLPTYDFTLHDTFKKPSWQFGLDEQLNSHLLLYVVTRRSFRSGGFNVFAPPTPGFGPTGGDEFKPQIATDVEVGFKYNGTIADMPFRVNFAAYDLWLKDNQNVTYININGAASAVTVNVPKAKVTGFELDSSLNPANWLTIGGAVNYTDARYTSNLVSVLGAAPIAFGPYPDAPKWSGAIYADVHVPVSDRLTASVRGDVSGQTKAPFSSTQATVNPGAIIPGYVTADFRVSLEDSKSGWTISGLVKNAFNRVYYVGGQGFESVFTVNTVVPADRRTFFVQVRKNF